MYSTCFVFTQLVLCSMLLATEPVNAQKNRSKSIKDFTISVDFHNSNIIEIFDAIESQSRFNFVYNFRQLDEKKKVSATYRNASLYEILLYISREFDVFFKRVDNNINVTKKRAGKTEPNPVEDLFAIDVSGKVTDFNGESLPGVNVVVKATKLGTITDSNGRYTISVEENDTLIFSYVGFENVEIPVEGRTVIDVTLSADVEQLDEIVVVGYGTQESKEITSAIVSVKEEAFNRGNLNDPEQLLAGKVAGLTISKVGGSPTEGSTIRLRGLTTFGANAEPLIVIDGVIGASLNNVDPNDIASVDVLKDASAGAIYGTRGSSGVIIITTKSGGANQKPRLELNAYTVLEEIANLPETATKEEFLNAGGVDFGFDTDWMDETTRTSNTRVYNVAYSASSGSTAYRASVNFRDVEGVLDSESFERLNARLNLSQNFFDEKLKLTGIFSFTRANIDEGSKGALRQALLWNPTAPVYIDGDPSQGFFETFEQSVFNPVSMNENLSRENLLKRTLINFKVDYEVIPGLTVSSNYAYQISSNLFGFFSNSQALTGAGRGLPEGFATSGRAERSTSDASDELIEFTTSYQKSFNDIDFTVLAGYGRQEQVFEDFWASNTDFITDDLLWNNLGLGFGISNPDGAIAGLGSSKNESILTSYFGRVNLSYKDTYNFSATLRREASSRFGENNRWGTFWAVSGSADLASLFEISTADVLKLRVGYGVTGNTPNERLAFLETLGSQSLGFVNGEFIPAVEPTSNPNPDLKWEEKGEFNVGIDYTVLEGKLSGSFDYFNRTTSDLLNTIDVPSPPNLFPTTLVNLGKLETNGFEVSINYTALNLANGLKWDIGGVFDTYETKLVKFNNLESSEIFIANLGTPGFNNIQGIRVKEGEPIGDIMAPQFAGFNEDGKHLAIDSAGNEILAVNAVRRDYIVAGNGIPDFSIGITNSFQYKNFDLNFLWRGVFGHDLANLPAAKLGHPVRAGQFRYITSGFHNPEDTDDSAWHTEYVEDASFIRLDNITLGYNRNLGDEAKLRVYVTGNNVVTITGYEGADPAPRFSDGNNILAPGLDRLGDYYPTRSYTIGATITF